VEPRVEPHWTERRESQLVVGHQPTTPERPNPQRLALARCATVT
jgi:hypothetical protein